MRWNSAASVVGGGCASLYEGLDELKASRGAIAFALLALIRDGNVMLGLPRSRNAQIQGSAYLSAGLSLDHDRGLLAASSTRPEQLVEKVAEPSLEHLDLGLRNRNAFRPVIGDGPCRQIVLGRAAGKRPRLSKQLVQLLGCGWRARSGRPGHPDRIAESPVARNRPSSRHASLRGLARKYRKSAAPGSFGGKEARMTRPSDSGF